MKYGQEIEKLHIVLEAREIRLLGDKSIAIRGDELTTHPAWLCELSVDQHIVIHLDFLMKM